MRRVIFGIIIGTLGIAVGFAVADHYSDLPRGGTFFSLNSELLEVTGAAVIGSIIGIIICCITALVGFAVATKFSNSIGKSYFVSFLINLCLCAFPSFLIKVLLFDEPDKLLSFYLNYIFILGTIFGTITSWFCISHQQSSLRKQNIELR